MAIQLPNDDDTFTVTDAELLDGGDSTVTYTLRNLTTSKHREILKKNTRFNRRGEKETNAEAATDDLLDWVLVSWTNVLDAGTSVSCERHYKLAQDSVRKGLQLQRAGLSQIVTEGDTRGESFRKA